MDMEKLVQMIMEDTQWADIGLGELYGRISVDTTDPVKSNSGNMFETVDPDGKELAALQTYLAMYNIGLDESENVTRGWLPQMYKGKGGQGLLFSERMIDCASLKDIKKFKYNKDLFVGDNPPKFEVGLFSSIFDEVKKKFIATLPECRSTFDDLISRTYATIKNLYFNE